VLSVAHENLAWKESIAEMEAMRQSHEICGEIILNERKGTIVREFGV